MTILLFLVITYILLSLSLYKVFEKAGVDPKKALIPGLNFVEWSKLIGRPAWWPALLLLPIVNIFIYAGMCVDMVRSFKKYSFWESALAVIYAPLSFFKLGKSAEPYDGPTLTKERAYATQMAEAAANEDMYTYNQLRVKNPYEKSQIREWAEAIVFAVFAAAFIRMFLIEAYVIPTSSMEGSLNVGDYLFVSKAHYGIRTPKTIAMIPLLHNRLPFGSFESYIESPSLPFKRLPAIETVDRNDPVVFNYPEGDSVYVTPGRTWSIYDYRRNSIPQSIAARIKAGREPLVTRPIDKMDHYIKRCLAIAGDTLEIRDRQVFINGKPGKVPTNVQYRYLVKHNGSLDDSQFSDWNISAEDQRFHTNDKGDTYRLLVLNEAQKEKILAQDPSIEIIPNNMYWVTVPEGYDNSRMKEMGIGEANVRSANSVKRLLLTLSNEQVSTLSNSDSSMVVERYEEGARLFPHDPVKNKGWNVDNYGPIWIPKKGATITITPKNLPAYRRAISVYEGNKLEVKNGRIYINGEQTSSYTFKLNYYWMMGDNRHNSEDSRVWGYVPENHIVGKPLFIWFSTKNANMRDGINWERIFTSADKQ